jgi:hypothetical protein
MQSPSSPAVRNSSTRLTFPLAYSPTIVNVCASLTSNGFYTHLFVPSNHSLKAFPISTTFQNFLIAHTENLILSSIFQNSLKSNPMSNLNISKIIQSRWTSFLCPLSSIKLSSFRLSNKQILFLPKALHYKFVLTMSRSLQYML